MTRTARTYFLCTLGAGTALAAAFAEAEESSPTEATATAPSATSFAPAPAADAGTPSASPASSSAPEITETTSTSAGAPNPPLPPQGDCGKGSYSVDGECIESRRLLSPRNERCEPVCRLGKECVGKNSCERIPLPNPYLHDGVYVRLGLGVGRAANDFQGWAAPAFEGAIGAAPSPGLTLGVGVYGALLPSLSDREVSGLYGVGPFFDVYPHPSEGFHIEAALTYTTLKVVSMEKLPCSFGNGCTMQVSTDRSDNGLGVVAGVGYEGWIATQESLGLLLRIQYFATSLGLHGPTNNGTTNSLVVPAVLLTLTHQ